MIPDWSEATESGDLVRVQSLLATGVNINALDKHGQTALMNAAVRGDTELVRLLVEKGAELNHTAKYRLSALMLAVINRRVEVVRILVGAGADKTLGGSKGEFAKTPIEYASAHGFEEISNILRKRS